MQVSKKLKKVDFTKFYLEGNSLQSRINTLSFTSQWIPSRKSDLAACFVWDVILHCDEKLHYYWVVRSATGVKLSNKRKMQQHFSSMTDYYIIILKGELVRTPPVTAAAAPVKPQERRTSAGRVWNQADKESRGLYLPKSSLLDLPMWLRVFGSSTSTHVGRNEFVCVSHRGLLRASVRGGI